MERRDPEIEARLKEQFQGSGFGETIHAFGSCDSTMERAHALVRDGASEGTLVFAARQTQGRGRLGRRWESPEGGAYFSLILKPSRPPAESPQLSLVAGLAAAEAILELTALSPSIRWPNDLLLDGRKVAGILIEVKDGAVVLGIGINVGTEAHRLPNHATSLAVQGAVGINPLTVTAAVCQHIHHWYNRWRVEGFDPLRQALRPWLGLFGRVIHLTAGCHQFDGTASDLDEAGRLLVRLDSGVQRAFEVGEVTLLR